MSRASNIRTRIDGMEAGQVFTYDTLAIPENEFMAAAKALSRLVSQGIVRRYKKGVYYKPKKTVFGELKPNEEVLLNAYLFENGEQIAYVTGTRLYNQMGLTTQVPTVIQVASQKKQVKTNIGALTIRPVKSYVEVTKLNVPLLQLLDVIKDFKIIPDFDKSQGVRFLKEQITGLPTTDIDRLVSFARAYPPKVRAFLGALLEVMGLRSKAIELKETLNPLSTYNFGLSEKILPILSNWNIS